MNADGVSDLVDLEDSYRAKKKRLAEAREVAAHRSPLPGIDEVALEVYLRRYYWQITAAEVMERTPTELYAVAAAHYGVGHTRPEGAVSVRAFALADSDADGALSSRTVIQVVTDDMPFIVDSVTAELNRQSRGIQLVVHPVLIVRRDITGSLKEIVNTSDPAEVPADGLVESWMHIEIDRVTDPEQLRQIEADLRRVLSDVREAVEDWPKMKQTAERIAAELESASPKGIDPIDVTEGAALLRWLGKDNFTFLGYREYSLQRVDAEGEAADSGEDVLRVVPASGLGILRSDTDESQSFRRMPPEARAKAREKTLLVLTKADSRSTVHRPVYLDYIGVKVFDDSGEVVGERRFLGLFTSQAYVTSVTTVPVVRRKVEEVIRLSGFPALSHSGKDLLDIAETYPRDELFQISAEELLPTALAVLQIRERRQTRLFLRRDVYGRFFSAIVFLPRDRYTTKVRLEMQEILMQGLHGESLEYFVHSTESVLTRLYFVVRSPGPTSHYDVPPETVARIEQQLIDAARSWEDDLSDVLVDQLGRGEASQLIQRYSEAFPEAYKSDFSAVETLADIEEIERIVAEAEHDPSASGLGMRLYAPEGTAPGGSRFKIYKVGDRMLLSDVLPVLQHMGVNVIDERPYLINCKDRPPVWVYDFGLTTSVTIREPGAELAMKFGEAFAATWRGQADNDGLNALVLLAGLNWRQVSVLRAYVRYRRQGGMTFSQSYVERALVNHPELVQKIVELFETKFDPEFRGDRAARIDELGADIRAALVEVSSLDEDRILSAVSRTVQATLRTNHFQVDKTGKPKSYLSLKLDPHAVPDLPAPRPFREIWVYSPRFEGVHLRFGAVARGGLRWSDRSEDMRTEILGLVKAQMVKNTVIVPTGAKGGFLAKRLPDPSDREAWLAEGVACYRGFISGMLDITDNLDGRTVVPPPRVVRHDADDSYLVVAADKGTATFSDIANEVAISYGYWLGDAFASGGSVGYDHKAMGITARGAWESVKRHFRELGVDTQSQDFSVVGIGDMSGDVFGNGMLLSQHIRLAAAFDHRHIFVDPNPEAGRSYAERRRLFELPRSSWADYDTSLISAGGGIWPRSAKAIPVSSQMRAMFNLASDVETLTPAELMRFILLADVDLLWNGGIGTYVKASTESNADVGDKANDAIRVNGADLRVRVVGEGGNLGLTQLGRIEYALSGAGGGGGKINTDAIDNSAGVDTSDHEVNIKILLDMAIRDGALEASDRSALLAEMTDEVGDLVLRDNYDQNVALACEVTNSLSLVDAHMRFMRSLTRSGRLDRALEFLPTDRQLAERARNGRGLTQPEFAVLLAYVKIAIENEIRESDLPDDPAFRHLLYDYFPSPLPDRFRKQMDEHPLHREIIATQIVNAVVNTAGVTGVFRMMEETGASTDVVVRAQTAARLIFDLQGVYAHTETLDTKAPADIQTTIRIETGRLVERATRWLLRNARQPLDIVSTVERYREGARDAIDIVPALLRGIDRDMFEGRQLELSMSGVHEDLAMEIAVFPKAIAILDLVTVAQETGFSVQEVADTYFYLADRLELSSLLERIIAMPRDDRWRAMARATLRDDLNAAHAQLTAEVLSRGAEKDMPDVRFAEWTRQAGVTQERAMSLLSDIASGESLDLATVVVAIRVVRELIQASSRAVGV